jgi:hypothetical protein
MIMRMEAAGRRTVAIVALLAAAILASPGALAQTELATKEAESRFKEGLARHDAGDEEGARLSFLEAYSVLKRPNILFNLARAEQLTGHPVEAIQHYKTFVADGTVVGADREIARQRIVELTPLVGHVTIEAPSGAELWIDNQLLPAKAPLAEPADVAAGPHTVQARLGGQTKSAQVSLSAGQTVTVKLDLVPIGAALVVVPIPRDSLANVPAQEESVKPEQASVAKAVTLVALGVGAIALLGAGVGLEVASSSASSTAATDKMNIQGGSSSSSLCNSPTPSAACMNLSNELGTRSTDANLGTGMFIGAGVLAAAFAATWVVWPKTRGGDGAMVLPLLSPNAAGLGLRGTF